MRSPLVPGSPIDVMFSALGDPTRRAIVERLASGDATVLELAAPFDISLPAISRHLKVLESAGLISRGRDAQQRPCRLEAAAFDELHDYLKKLQQTPPKKEKKKSHGRKKP